MRMETPDETLATAAAQGDRAAFAALLARHYDRVFRTAFRLTGRRADAEDLAQDICAALPARLRLWRGEARFTTWLYRVTVNAAHDQRRRQSTRSRAATGWGDWETERQASMAEDAGAQAWLAAAIAGFGQLLTGAPQLGDWGWDQAIALAEGARGSDSFGYRAEAVTLMRLAQSLAQ